MRPWPRWSAKGDENEAAMRVSLNARFYEERERYALKFTCEDCTHFDAPKSRCAHEYPNKMHLRAAFEPGAEVHAMFCKEFEFV